MWDLKTGRCERVLSGHTFWVYSVGVIADGSRAVSAGSDDTVREWDLVQGESQSISLGHVDCIGMPANGEFVVSSNDNELRVWDPLTGQSLRTLKGHTAQVSDVKISSDGTRAVSTSFDGTLRVWDIATGRCRRILKGHTGVVYEVSLTDGERAISGSLDKTLRIWDLVLGKCVKVIKGLEGSVDSVSVTADGQLALLAVRNRGLIVYDLRLAKEIRTLARSQHDPMSEIQHVIVTPDGGRAISSERNGTMRLWDIALGHCVLELRGHTNTVHGMSLAPHGRRVASAGSDGTLRLWNLDSGVCEVVVRGSDQFRSVAVASSINRVIAGNTIGEAVVYVTRGINL